MSTYQRVLKFIHEPVKNEPNLWQLLYEQSPTLKTRFCQHEHNCARNALSGALRGFLIGYGVRSGLSIALAIIFGRMFRLKVEDPKPEETEQHPKKHHPTALELLKEYLTGPDTIRFALFLSSFNAVYKSVLCFLRYMRQRDDDGWNSFWAGMLAGSTILLDDKSRWSEMSMFLFAQACASVARYLVTKGFIFKDEHSWISKLFHNHTNTILFSLFAAIIMMTFIYSPELFPSSYMKFFEAIEGEDSNVAQRYRIKFRRYWRTFGFSKATK